MKNIHETAWIHESAVLEGAVTLLDNASVWCNAVLRGIGMRIQVGKNTNVQDCVVLHGDIGHDVFIGNYCSIGHGAVIHGCSIGDNCVIGMGSVILDDAHIGDGSIVGAGAVVPAGSDIPPGSLVLGMPAKVKRSLSPEDIQANIRNAEEYLAFAAEQKAK